MAFWHRLQLFLARFGQVRTFAKFLVWLHTKRILCKQDFVPYSACYKIITNKRVQKWNQPFSSSLSVSLLCSHLLSLSPDRGDISWLSWGVHPLHLFPLPSSVAAHANLTLHFLLHLQLQLLIITTRTKHIDIKYHFVKEKVAGGKVELGYISTYGPDSWPAYESISKGQIRTVQERILAWKQVLGQCQNMRCRNKVRHLSLAGSLIW